MSSDRLLGVPWRLARAVVEPVADTATVLDESWRILMWLDFHPEPPDQALEVNGARITSLAPHPVHERLVGQHATSIPHQVEQQLVFERGELHSFTAQGDALVPEVQPE